MWKPLLEEILKILFTICTIYTEHTKSRNMKARFRGNNNTIVCQSWNGYYVYRNTRSRNMKAILRGNHEIIGYPNWLLRILNILGPEI